MQKPVRHDIRQFVVHNFLFGQGEQLSDHESFLEGGIIDSTGVLELVAFLEQHFGISIGHDELVPANLDSLDNVTGFVERKLNQATRVAS